MTSSKIAPKDNNHRNNVRRGVTKKKPSKNRRIGPSSVKFWRTKAFDRLRAVRAKKEAEERERRLCLENEHLHEQLEGARRELLEELRKSAVSAATAEERMENLAKALGERCGERAKELKEGYEKKIKELYEEVEQQQIAVVRIRREAEEGLEALYQELFGDS